MAFNRKRETGDPVNGISQYFGGVASGVLRYLIYRRVRAYHLNAFVASTGLRGCSSRQIFHLIYCVVHRVQWHEIALDNIVLLISKLMAFRVSLPDIEYTHTIPTLKRFNI